QLGGARTIAMSNDVRIGLAVTSHNNTNLCNVLITSPSGTILTGGERTLTLAPALDRTGTADISVVANDGILKTTNMFSVTIPAVNDPNLLIPASATWR